MTGEKRRDTIIGIIKSEKGPVSASKLAEQLHVSRQAIVGDIALIRAQGMDIVATARGYILPEPFPANRYVGKIACLHSGQDTREELYTIVDFGGLVVDVIVEHDFYGQIVGQLNLAARSDVDAFIAKVEASETRLLSELTGGVHIHTVSCRDGDTFEKIRKALLEKGFLYEAK